MQGHKANRLMNSSIFSPAVSAEFSKTKCEN